MIPIACFSTQITSSISFELVLPQKTSLALRAYHFLGENFGVGVLCPYRILIDGSNSAGFVNGTEEVHDKSVHTQEAFEVMYKLVDSLVANEKRKKEYKNATVTCSNVMPLPNATENRMSNPNMMVDTVFQEDVMEMMKLIEDYQEGIAFPAAQASRAAAITEDGWHIMGDDDGDDDFFEKQWEPFLQQLAAMETMTNSSRGSREPPCSMPKDELTTPPYSSSSSISNITKYESIAIAGGMHVPFTLFVVANLCDAYYDGHCPIKILHTIAYADKSVTSKDQKTTYMNAILPEDPFSRQGIDWLLMARETIQCLEANGDLKGYSVYIDGIVAISYDAVEKVYQTFPRMIVITLVVVFVLMGLFFRSVLTPFRSAATIALTTSFGFGLAVLAFQKGDVDWVGIPGIHDTGEISFIAPAMAFSIIVGLGLDYDVFLISRILEFRRGGGHTHESSITEGLAATGGIITAAGLIMAVAFGSLMFSSTPALVQWSFMLTVAVLMDTFVIRTMVVPILMGYTGKYTWWPQKLPDDVVEEESEESENTETPLERESGDNDEENEAIMA